MGVEEATLPTQKLQVTTAVELTNGHANAVVSSELLHRRAVVEGRKEVEKAPPVAVRRTLLEVLLESGLTMTKRREIKTVPMAVGAADAVT